jgi:hypothetical protein
MREKIQPLPQKVLGESGYLHAKEIITRLKRPPTDWEKIFASYTSDKGVIIRIFREPNKTKLPRINETMMKWANQLNRNFSKEV